MRRSTSFDSLAMGTSRFSPLVVAGEAVRLGLLDDSRGRRVALLMLSLLLLLEILPYLLLSRDLGELFSLREGDLSAEDDFFLEDGLLFDGDNSDEDFFFSELDDLSELDLLSLAGSSFRSRFFEGSYSAVRDFCEETLLLLVVVLVTFFRSASTCWALSRGSTRLGIRPRRSLSG